MRSQRLVSVEQLTPAEISALIDSV